MAGIKENSVGREPRLSAHAADLLEAQRIRQEKIDSFVNVVASEVVTQLRSERRVRSLRYFFETPAGESYDSLIRKIGNTIFEAMSDRYLTYGNMFQDIGFSCKDEATRSNAWSGTFTVTFKK